MAGQSLRGVFYPAGQSLRLTSPFFKTMIWPFSSVDRAISKNVDKKKIKVVPNWPKRGENL